MKDKEEESRTKRTSIIKTTNMYNDARRGQELRNIWRGWMNEFDRSVHVSMIYELQACKPI
jgi:hypothetical protein